MPDARAPGPGSEDALRDFIAEAEEILETLSDDLRDLEQAFAARRPHLDRIHAIFRRAHTLKGFAGLLGFPEIASVTHALEDLLSRLRLGGALDGATLDLLHDTLDALLGAVRELRSGAAARGDPTSLVDRLARAAAAVIVPETARDDHALLPEELRSCLTEHEESRLRLCLARGMSLSFVRVCPDPRALEDRLRDIAERVALAGDLISTLPVLGDADAGLVFDLLVASDRPLSADDLPDTVTGLRTLFAPLTAPAPGFAQSPEEALPATAEGAGPGAPDSSGTGDPAGPPSSLRVPVARLDDVLAQVGELSIAVASLEHAVTRARARHPHDRLALDLVSGMRTVLTRLRALQRGAIEARLVPLEQVFARIGRAVARAARASGKEVDLHTLGADTEIDKSVMDVLAAPLMHMAANAVDHGIETPEERARVSKAQRGRLVLSAFRRGPSVVIDVIDDGRGIDCAAVRSIAVARGWWPEHRPMTAEEASDIIFRPGFSTAPKVSEVSGRGVGMDVVRGVIRSLKGTIVVRSIEGQGTTFSVTVPISLALVPAIIVVSGGERYAIPVAAIHENLHLDPSRVRRLDQGEVYERPQGPLPLLRLETLLARDVGSERAIGRYAVVTGEEGRRIGIVCDGLLGHQEVVVKPIGRLLGNLPGVAGAADLGDATAVVVLDPAGLISGDVDGRAAC